MLDPSHACACVGRPWDAATAFEVRPHRVSGSRAEIGNVRGTIPSVRKATQEPRHRDAQGLLQRLRLRIEEGGAATVRCTSKEPADPRDPNTTHTPSGSLRHGITRRTATRPEVTPDQHTGATSEAFVGPI